MSANLKSSRRLLLVSAHPILDFERDTVGIHKRLALFIEAASGLAALDILYFLPLGEEVPDLESLEARYRQRWGRKIKIRFCPRVDFSNPITRNMTRLIGLLNYFGAVAPRELSGPVQTAAIEDAVGETRPAAVLVHRIPTMGSFLKTTMPLPPLFLDFDDVEHIKLARLADLPGVSFLKACFRRLLVPTMIRAESRAAQACEMTFVASPVDRDLLVRDFQLDNTVTIPNAVMIPPLQPLVEEPVFLYLGNMNYPPNAHGGGVLLKEIWPLIIKAIPEARLIVAGNAPEKISGYDSRIPGVEFAGFVPDLAELYRKVRFVCCPVFAGSGTRVKMVEAAAYGKPVVATRMGAEGLDFEPGREYVLADDPESFALACVELCKNPSKSQSVGEAARAGAIARYDQAQVVASIRDYLESGMTNHSNMDGQ